MAITLALAIGSAPAVAQSTVPHTDVAYTLICTTSISVPGGPEPSGHRASFYLPQKGWRECWEAAMAGKVVGQSPGTHFVVCVLRGDPLDKKIAGTVAAFTPRNLNSPVEKWEKVEWGAVEAVIPARCGGKAASWAADSQSRTFKVSALK